MEQTPTIFTLRIDDVHGVNVRTLFPGLSAATIGEFSVGPDVDNLGYAVDGKNYEISLTGHDFSDSTFAPGVHDWRGWFTAVRFDSVPAVGPHIQLAHMEVSVGGQWGATDGPPLASTVGFAPDILLNSTLGGSPVKFAEVGNAGPDKLWGSDYSDVLYGEGGHDRLTGNDGDDVFVFDGTPGKASRDHVTDFAHGHDRLEFDTDDYTALAGVDLNKAFHDITKGMKHEDKGDRILYNHHNGHLFYDPDGDKTGKHDHKPVLVATLDNHPHLGWHDLLIA